jgi:hypothetical protein
MQIRCKRNEVLECARPAFPLKNDGAFEQTAPYAELTLTTDVPTWKVAVDS